MNNPSKSSDGADISPPLSVVIGIRNWGLDRLQVALRSHRASDIQDLEIVISDYGSANCDDVFRIAETFGCKYIYSEADVWSRSAAINAGIRNASSDNILTTDADIIFSAKSHSILLENLRRMPDSVQIIQCRDLPEGFGSDNLSLFEWKRLFQVSSIRPRWGMGGSATFKRDLFARIHGFDERMTVWGGEDNDFVQRARRTGAILNWIENPDAQIYHIWHPPDSRGNSASEAKVVENNKKLLQEDRTSVRNLSRSYRAASSFKPTVSIVIAAKNDPSIIKESVESCLKQSFQDFEILVVDDGSRDELETQLHQLGDDRVRLLTQRGSRGSASARNYATGAAHGEYVAIHDDADLMLPLRLEHQLGAITDDAAGSYGGWINFDDNTGALKPMPGRVTFNHAATMFGRTPAHSAILVRRRVLEQVRYNENFLADADHHLLSRIARAGIRLVHCGHYVTLRRVNQGRPIEAGVPTPAPTAGISNAMIRGTYSPDRDHQNRKAARAIPQADIPFSELVRATELLPSRLLTNRTKLEFASAPAGGSDDIAAIGSVIDICGSINIEFDDAPGDGIKSVTLPACDEDTRTRAIFALSGITDITVSDIVIPIAYTDTSLLDERLGDTGFLERHNFDIGKNLEDALRIVRRHCDHCFLMSDPDSGLRLSVGPLPQPIENLVRAKLKMVLHLGRADVEA